MSGCSSLYPVVWAPPCSKGGEGCGMGAGVCIQTLTICFSGNEAAVAICIKPLLLKEMMELVWTNYGVVPLSLL